jgi:hypothetical protein
MKIFIRPTDAATYDSINLLEVEKKYVIVHAKRFHNTIIQPAIQYSEHETLDIFLPWSFSSTFTHKIITASVRSILIFKGLDQLAQYYVIGN